MCAQGVGLLWLPESCMQACKGLESMPYIRSDSVWQAGCTLPKCCQTEETCNLSHYIPLARCYTTGTPLSTCLLLNIRSRSPLCTRQQVVPTSIHPLLQSVHTYHRKGVTTTSLATQLSLPDLIKTSQAWQSRPLEEPALLVRQTACIASLLWSLMPPTRGKQCFPRRIPSSTYTEAATASGDTAAVGLPHMQESSSDLA